MDLLYLLHSLLRKKWIILLCTLTGLIAGAVFYLFKEKEYVSLSQYSTGFTMEKKIKLQEGDNFNLFEIDTRFSNVIVAFGSDKVFGMLTYKLMLHDLEDRQPFRTVKPEELKKINIGPSDLTEAKLILRQKINALELLSAYIPSEKKVIDLIKLYKYNTETLFKKVTLTRLERTDFINIFASSENPYLSAFMANTAGDQLIRFFNSIYGVRVKSAYENLDSLTTLKKNVVDSLSKKLENYKTKIGPTTSGEKATAAMDVVKELYGKYQEETGKLNNLNSERNTIEAQLNALGTETSTTNSNAGNNNLILQLTQKNIDLEKEKVGKTEEQKKKIQEEIDANVNKIIALNGSKTPDRSKEIEKRNAKRDELLNRKLAIDNEIIAVKANVEQYTREKDKYEKLINQGGGEDVIVGQMERDLELASKEYENLRQSKQNALDINVNPENNFKQTNMAMPADKPSPGRAVIITGLAGGIMFFLSTFLVLLTAFLDSSYKYPERYKFQSGLHLLAMVKKVDMQEDKSWKYIQSGGTDVAAGEDTLFLQTIRNLRFQIENSGKKVILVTSTRDGEGKTFLMQNLAASLSITKKKILLIDANFANNELTRNFEAKPVLEKFSVNTDQGLAEKIASITSMTPMTNTTLVGCNTGEYTPEEILPKNHLFTQLSKLAETYDYILIEAASLNNHPDSRELSAFADGILLVVSASSSAAPIDKESYRYLAENDKFIGSVLNAVEKQYLKL